MDIGQNFDLTRYSKTVELSTMHHHWQTAKSIYPTILHLSNYEE